MPSGGGGGAAAPAASGGAPAAAAAAEEKKEEKVEEKVCWFTVAGFWALLKKEYHSRKSRTTTWALDCLIKGSVERENTWHYCKLKKLNRKKNKENT